MRIKYMIVRTSGVNNTEKKADIDVDVDEKFGSVELIPKALLLCFLIPPNWFISPAPLVYLPPPTDLTPPPPSGLNPPSLV